MDNEKKQYYDNQKAEINKEYQQLVMETYDDVKRAVIKEVNKSQLLQKKLQEIEAKEKGELKPKFPKKEDIEKMRKK